MRVIALFAVLGGLGLGALAGWHWTAAPAPLAQPRAPQPPPPAPIRYQPDADLAWLTRRDPWGARIAAPVSAPAPTPAAQPAVVRPWRLGGVMAWGGDMMAIVLGPAGVAPEYRRVGENLPDGSRIVDISNGAVTVDLAGARRVLRLTTPK